MKKIITNIGVLGLSLLLTACGASNPPTKSEGHLSGDVAPLDTIPATVNDAPILPEPEQRSALETYTVVVNQVPVRELLFSMARDASLNLDIDSDIEGRVTMNAIDQTLPQILERLTRQVAINYTLEDDTLHIRADKPYLHLYSVNYLNMSRLSKGSVEVSTEISSTGTTEGSAGNNSSSEVNNVSDNEFWKTLIVNFGGIINEDVKGDEAGSSQNIMVNRETGVVGVRATFRQHRQIQAFLDRVIGGAQRQVMIEATIAEVTLSDRYQAGIDWSMVKMDGLGNITDQITQSLLGGNLGTSPFFELSGSTTTSSGDNLSATLKALETFGDVKVLSSPKVMALNNQTAMLKVVDNAVYFSVEVTPEIINAATGVVTSPATISTDINTVPIGFVMSVMPFIDSNDVVTLNIRPTISRIVDTVNDPNPELAKEGVISSIPVIQVREIESVLKVNNGDTAVIGGLMQDQVNKKTIGVPILSSIPFLGALFSYQDDEYVKSELVIFIRPVVVHEASLNGDLKEYRKYLMDDFDASPAQSR
ncbi:MAG: pilus (MSHA type) biogenesis protein MshL [Gammaproteobacteria bacterium]|nr:pilus (MSHA type) biogenesis protein MshL [Gammaproteobacteria bacterium]